MAKVEDADRSMVGDGEASLRLAVPAGADPGDADRRGFRPVDPLEASMPHLAAAAAVASRMVEDNTSFIALASARADRISRRNEANGASLARLLAD